MIFSKMKNWNRQTSRNVVQVDDSPGKVLFIGKHNILFRIPPRDTNIETFLKHDRNVCPGNGTETDCCIRVLKSVHRNPKSFRFEKIKTKSPARVFWKKTNENLVTVVSLEKKKLTLGPPYTYAVVSYQNRRLRILWIRKSDRNALVLIGLVCVRTWRGARHVVGLHRLGYDNCGAHRVGRP